MGNSISRSRSQTTAAPAVSPATRTVIVRKTIKEDDSATLASDENAAAQKSLQGKVFAITGGASGIGLGTAKMLSSRGATVCIADVDPAAMKITEDYFTAQNVPFMISRVDVSQCEQVDAWIDLIVKEHGRLDGAANVAGVIGRVHGITAVADMENSEWDKIIAINLTGTMYCMRAELRHIVDGGSIVNVTSIHGLKGFARHSAYDSSKHGIVGLTKAAAQEVGAREIRVNAVAPGSVYTPLMQKEWDHSGRPKDAPFDEPTAFQRRGTIEEAASVMAFLLGPESTFVSGSVYQVDGAWT
jgi:NAD(P)-dependent dehydrogenase (short-subunit alcohol dehydrogenase family)